MIDGKRLADVGFNYLGVPYSEMDCQAFVEQCLKDCGLNKNLAGSNAWYREVRNNGRILTPEECVKEFGAVPKGAFLFILKNDGREPEKYKPDGLGNASHIGICTGDRGEGAINSSSSRGCVCESRFKGKSINGGWNRVGLWNLVDYENGGGVEVDYEAKVVGGYLNMRESPNKASKRLCQIPEGEIIRVSEERSEWAKTAFKEHVGWVMREYIERIESGYTVAVDKDELETVYDIIGKWLRG